LPSHYMDDMDDISRFVVFGQAVGCAVRLALLQVLGEEGRTLGDAARRVGVSASTAHYHYGVLIRAGLVKRKGRRRGCKYTWPEARWALVCKTPRQSSGSPDASLAGR